MERISFIRSAARVARRLSCGSYASRSVLYSINMVTGRWVKCVGGFNLKIEDKGEIWKGMELILVNIIVFYE